MRPDASTKTTKLQRLCRELVKRLIVAIARPKTAASAFFSFSELGLKICGMIKIALKVA